MMLLDVDKVDIDFRTEVHVCCTLLGTAEETVLELCHRL